MTETLLPRNLHRLAQREFDAIPGAPWVYWAPAGIRRLFKQLPSLRQVAQPRQGLATTNNSRFVRFWWEVGHDPIAFGCGDTTEARASRRRWFGYMKGGEYHKWYGNQEHVVNWGQDGAEIKEAIVCRYPYLDGKWEWVAKNTDYYFREAITWSKVTSGGFSIRYTPAGFVFDVAGTSVFPPEGKAFHAAGVLNSEPIAGILRLISPTLNYEVGQIASVPLRTSIATDDVAHLATQCTLVQVQLAMLTETTFDFVAPPRWNTGLEDLVAARSHLTEYEQQIDEKTYQLYGISDADRAAIEAELAGGSPTDEEEGASTAEEAEESAGEPPMTREELAVRWISYAVGIILSRFQPGVSEPLGRAVYRSADFAIGSLPEPDQDEFDQLVGPPERFAYVDSEGGRHLFPADVEKALLELALPDGIAVLDEGHPRDLPTLLERALALMLGEGSAQEVIVEATGGQLSTPLRASLRNFLERDFFTKWHLKWYRKRPVYWPLQSARRTYGFVLFHEKVERDTLYVLQRDYLDHKLNGLRLQIGDRRRQLETKEGGARKQLEREMDDLTQMLDELTQFAATIERLVREGYEPQPDWIDDGIILRLAPLWDLMPIWTSEPQKHWERLQRGDFAWSHIAMHYCPERVREKCKSDRSLAIAHGL